MTVMSLDRERLADLDAAACDLLEADPDLADNLDHDAWPAARRAARAVAVELPTGAWDPDELCAATRDGLGLFLLAGTVVRRTACDRRRAAEILGAGDLICPSRDADAPVGGLPMHQSWTVVEPLQVALLDETFVRRCAAACPPVLAALTRRLHGQSHAVAAHLAILQQPCVERRLELMLGHLAERWGRVTRDGVVLSLPLTHRLLGELVGAQRPTVTLGMGRLAERGVLRRGDGQLLLRTVPGDADALAA